MAKAPRSEYFIAYAVGALLALLAVGFFLAWIFLKAAPKISPDIVYTSFGPMVISTQKYSIKTSIAIQTSSGNEDWAKQNKNSLEGTIKNFLANEDAQIMLSKKGLRSLQDAIKSASNTALHTANVQNVLFTDFLLVPNDN